MLSLCFLDLLKSLRSSFGAGPEKLEVNLNSSVDKTELRREQRDRQLCRWKVTLISEKYFIWIGWECYQQHREISIRALCSGVVFAVTSSISPLVPRARHWPSNSLMHSALCSGATIQLYDTQPLKVEAVRRPFGCTVANTKEEDVMIFIYII